MHPLHLLSTLIGECLVHRYRKCQVTLLTQLISSPGTPYSLNWSTSLSFLVCLLSLPITLIHHTYAATKMFYVLLQNIIPHANNMPNLSEPVQNKPMLLFISQLASALCRMKQQRRACLAFRLTTPLEALHNPMAGWTTG